MSVEQSDIQKIEAEAAQDAKSARKFMFILMLIPIGLGLGVVLSNINFRKQEDKKAEMEQFKVSQLINKDDFRDDMGKIVSSHGEDPNYLLRHISSTLGLNNYLTRRPSQNDEGILGYYDIKGDDEKVITAVIVELDVDTDPVAKASLIAIPTAVIKSLAGEKDFPHTLRFVFLPKKYQGDPLNLRVKGESIESQFLIRVGGEFTLDDDVAWRSSGYVWQHPAMVEPHESLRGKLTEGRVELAIQAAHQLKSLLAEKM